MQVPSFITFSLLFLTRFDAALCFVQPRPFATTNTVKATTGRTWDTSNQNAWINSQWKDQHRHEHIWNRKDQSLYSMISTNHDENLSFIKDSIFLFSSGDIDSIASANAALEGVRTFFTVIAVLILGFVGLTYATVTFIIPKASEQLERDTKRLRPGLWEEYEAKLGPGETMATRPDLLQELGNIMQPLIMEDFERSANAKDNKSRKQDNATVQEKRNARKKYDDDNPWKD
jgi:hypothetical protein